MTIFDSELDLFDPEAEHGFDALDLEAWEQDLEYDLEAGGDVSADMFDLDGELDGELEFELDLEVDPEVIGADTRKRIRNTRNVPFRYICHLSMGCTGTLVAPNKVLTSAHCVYDRGNKREFWRGRRATPGRNGARAPFGSARIVRVNYPSAYRTATSYNAAWPHDYAVLTLDRRLRVPGGAWTRLRAIDPATLVKLKLNTAGYPANRGRRQYWTYNKVMSVSGARMRHVLDTKGGQSGSPIWLRYKNARSIVAIHKAGFSGSPQQNRAVALTNSNLPHIRAWIKS